MRIQPIMTGWLLCGAMTVVAAYGVMAAQLLCTGDAVSGASVPLPSVPVSRVVTEDMPEWDCATMGSRVCGPTSAVSR